MNQTLKNLAANWHVSVPLLITIALEVVPIWVPQYKVQCSETQKALMLYGIGAAAISGPQQPQPPKQ